MLGLTQESARHTPKQSGTRMHLRTLILASIAVVLVGVLVYIIFLPIPETRDPAAQDETMSEQGEAPPSD